MMIESESDEIPTKLILLISLPVIHPLLIFSMSVLHKTYFPKLGKFKVTSPQELKNLSPTEPVLSKVFEKNNTVSTTHVSRK